MNMHPDHNDPPLIAGPVPNPSRPARLPPPGAWDTHAHVFGPAEKFPFAPGRGYTPPPAPAEKYIALLDRLGLARGVIVQGNAHGYDNRVVLDALDRHGPRVRGVAITDTRIAPATLRDWHRRGMRGLRFHVFSAAGKPGYVRGVGLDVFEIFRPVMRELGWVMQLWCDWRVLPDLAGKLREIAAELPVVIDHMLNIPAARGTRRPGVPGAPSPRRRGPRARQAVGAVSPLREISRLCRRARFPRRAGARQSRTPALGHRLAASADRRRRHAGRRPSRGSVQ